MIPISILHVEDSEDDASLIIGELKRGGFSVTSLRVQTREDFERALKEQVWDAVISDFYMPDFNGLAALGLFQGLKIDIPFLLVSGAIGEEQAVEAMKAGVTDYVMKDNLTRLVPALKKEIDECAKRRESLLLLREREDQLRHAQKVEAIAQIAGGLAHDINNILGVVDLHSESILQNCGDPSLVQSSVSEIQKAVERANRLVRQLLTIGRRQVFSPTLLDLNQSIQELESMLRIALGEGSRLKYRLEPELPAILADQAQLEQILINLVMNSRDAMPDGGEVAIETLKEDGGERIRLVFRDTGSGMDERTKQRIFEPFFTTKEIGKGSGLGLSVVFGIIQLHQGQIAVESSPGKGTSFYISFPIAKPSEPAE